MREKREGEYPMYIMLFFYVHFDSDLDAMLLKRAKFRNTSKQAMT